MQDDFFSCTTQDDLFCALCETNHRSDFSVFDIITFCRNSLVLEFKSEGRPPHKIEPKLNKMTCFAHYASHQSDFSVRDILLKQFGFGVRKCR